MLHEITDYADRKGIFAEAGFSTKRIQWLINFSPEGYYLGIVSTSSPDGNGGKGREFTKVPHLKFCGDTPMRQFLVDTAGYALLYGENNPSEKLIAKNEYFRNLLKQSGNVEPFLRKVADTLSVEETRLKICNDLEQQTPKAKPSNNITFAEVGSKGVRIIIELSTWHEWWRKYFPTLFKKSKISHTMRCFISGDFSESCLTHPKIKGLGDVGGKVETTLVGFNQDAFCSYGLKQSSNAAISKESAQKYAAGLNNLISKRSHKLAGAKVVHWYAGRTEVHPREDPIGLLDESMDLAWLDELVNEEAEEKDALHRARLFLNSLSSGENKRLSELQNYRYFS